MRLDKPGDAADRRKPDRAPQQVPPAGAHGDLVGARPGAWQRGAGARLAVEHDLNRAAGAPADQAAYDNVSVAADTAPSGGTGGADDRVRQGLDPGLRDVPRQCVGECLGGTGRVTQAQPRRRQAEPCGTHVFRLGNREEQCSGSRSVAAQACGGERQRDGAVVRRQPMGTIEPAHRGRTVARHQRLLTLKLRVTRQRDGVVGGVSPAGHRLDWSGEGATDESKDSPSP